MKYLMWDRVFLLNAAAKDLELSGHYFRLPTRESEFFFFVFL